MEYNHLEELGFAEDRQTICSSYGLLTSGDPMRRMCDRFIRDGGRIYDVLTAYDGIMRYELSRDDKLSENTVKTLAPLLKASGVSDRSLYDQFRKDMCLTPGSDVIHYISGLMTTHILTEAYEHHAIALCESLNILPEMIESSEILFDDLEMDKREANRFRGFANDLSALNVPKITSSDDGTPYIDGRNSVILETAERLISDIYDTEFMYLLKDMRSLGGNEKTFSLIDIRRRTQVDLDCTAYIGNSSSDYPVMDMVRDEEGLALSFNGDAYAVRGSNVAVMSQDSIVPAAIVSEFYRGGMDGVYSLIDSWDRKKLQRYDPADRHLFDTLLRRFPSKLPSVIAVDDDNIDDVIKQSETFRRKQRF